MSRLELAMEKAVKLREQVAEPVAEVAAQPAAGVAPESGPRVIMPVLPPTAHAARTLSPNNPYLVTLNDPHSPAAEEYRKLKSALVKMTDGPTFRNAIMITSSVPSEGKTLTALNLAMSMAQGLDHTVLLIDADLRRPSLHRYLEMEQGPGIADILKGKVEIGECIVPTGIGKLSIIPAGSEVDNPVELFSSQKMRGIVEELKNRYPDRYLIFDTPPVLPFAESRSLANIVDGVLYVVMERLASQVDIREGLESVKSGTVLGLVYNGATDSGKADRYSYYEGYRKRPSA